MGTVVDMAVAVALRVAMREEIELPVSMVVVDTAAALAMGLHTDGPLTRN